MGSGGLVVLEADPVKGHLAGAVGIEAATRGIDCVVRIGRILDECDRLGLLERATIVLLSDHGEEFQEDGLQVMGL